MLAGAGQASQNQLEKLLAFLDLLVRWNRAYNLTSVRDPVEMVSRHVLDSLSALSWIPDGFLIDAGSGAGLPGIPLAIMRPDLNVTLVDSIGKKIRFVRHVIRQLDLDNVRAAQARLESWNEDRIPDAVISRAFSSLVDFAAAARHLARAETRLLAMKGRYPENELKELPSWLRVLSVEKLVVPGLQQDRHLVIMSVSK